MTAQLAEPTPSSVAGYDPGAEPVFASNTPEPAFLAAVERAKEEIRAGEAFQVVVAQRFEVPSRADALDIYRVLRRENPSPYMYLVRMPGPDGDGHGAFDIVGSSPEALVKVNGDIITKTELESRQIEALRARMKQDVDPASLKNDEQLKQALAAHPEDRYTMEELTNSDAFEDLPLDMRKRLSGVEKTGE